jgi:hypothetical protein
MLSMRRLVLVAFLSVACGGATVACGAVPAQARTLSLAFHSGDTYKYSFHSTTKQTIVAIGTTIPTDIELTAGEAVKVNSVDSSGVADLTLTVSNFVIKSTTGGVTNTTTGMPATTMDVKVAADGRIVSADGNQLAAGNPLLAFSGIGGGFFVTAVLPSNTVKPGDAWSKDYDQANPAGTGSIHVTSNSKYLRDESLNGVNAAVVETTSNGSIDMNISTPATAGATTGGFGGMAIQGTVTTDVTTWIDPNGHRVLKTHSTVSNDGTMTINLSSSTAPPGLTGPVTIKGTGTTDLTPA